MNSLSIGFQKQLNVSKPVMFKEVVPKNNFKVKDIKKITLEESLAMHFPKQRKILEMGLKGLTHRQMANIMGMKEPAIRYHITKILKLEDCFSMRELIVKYQKLGAQNDWE